MPKLIGSPTPVPSPGKLPRHVDEFVGLENTGDSGVSISRVRCDPGWEEPAVSTKFDVFSLVVKGMLVVEHNEGVIQVEAGQAVHVFKDEWVRYSVGASGAEMYVVCIPAYSPASIRRA